MSKEIEETEVGPMPGWNTTAWASTGNFSISQSESMLDATSTRPGDVLRRFDRLVARMAEQNAAASDDEIASDVAAARAGMKSPR